MKTLLHKNHKWAPSSKYEFWKVGHFSEKLKRACEFWIDCDVNWADCLLLFWQRSQPGEGAAHGGLHNIF
jgi:phosphoribosyl-AMP cyclohydrolase